MKIIGLVLLIFGLVDVIGALVGFDLWRGFIGWETMPDILWSVSAYIEIAIGGYLLKN